MTRIKTMLAVLMLAALPVCASAALMTDTDKRWEELGAAAERRAEGRKQAQALEEKLNSAAVSAPLFSLWKTMVNDPPRRLVSAWSILHSCVPDGDSSRWAEVNYFELPSETPRAFMVIDALYAALTELPKQEGGVWLAEELLRQFSKSSRGRYDFLGICPQPVADALARIKSETGMIGQWKPRQVMGTLPIARPVSGVISYTKAQNEDMQFLDGAGIPASNGFYAWNRKTGKIYRICIDNDPYFLIHGF